VRLRARGAGGVQPRPRPAADLRRPAARPVPPARGRERARRPAPLRAQPAAPDRHHPASGGGQPHLLALLLARARPDARAVPRRPRRRHGDRARQGAHAPLAGGAAPPGARGLLRGHRRGRLRGAPQPRAQRPYRARRHRERPALPPRAAPARLLPAAHRPRRRAVGQHRARRPRARRRAREPLPQARHRAPGARGAATAAPRAARHGAGGAARRALPPLVAPAQLRCRPGAEPGEPAPGARGVPPPARRRPHALPDHGRGGRSGARGRPRPRAPAGGGGVSAGAPVGTAKPAPRGAGRRPAVAAPAPCRVLVIGQDLGYLVRFRGHLVRALVAGGDEVVVTTPDPEPAAPPVAALGARYHRLPFSRAGMNPVLELRGVARLRREIAAVAPDAVFAYGAKAAALGLLAAAQAGVKRRYAMLAGLGFAFVEDGRRSPKRAAARAVQLLLYRLNFAGTRAVIFHNADDRDELVRRGAVRRDKTVVVPGSGVPVERFVPTPHPAGPARFLFVGRLLRSKGVEELV